MPGPESPRYDPKFNITDDVPQWKVANSDQATLSGGQGSHSQSENPVSLVEVGKVTVTKANWPDDVKVTHASSPSFFGMKFFQVVSFVGKFLHKHASSDMIQTSSQSSNAIRPRRIGEPLNTHKR